MDWQWRFLDFVLPSGTNPVAEWYAGIGSQGRSDFDSLLRKLRPLRKFPQSTFKHLVGKKYKGLNELRWTTNNKEHRVIGSFAPNRSLVMFVGCTHKGKVYDPPDALISAVERYNQFKKERGTTVERKF